MRSIIKILILIAGLLLFAGCVYHCNNSDEFAIFGCSDTYNSVVLASSTEDDSVTITATVYNNAGDVIESGVTWSLNWSDIDVNNDVSDYVSSVESNNVITLTKVQNFSDSITLTGYSSLNNQVYDSIQIECQSDIDQFSFVLNTTVYSDSINDTVVVDNGGILTVNLEDDSHFYNGCAYVDMIVDNGTTFDVTADYNSSFSYSYTNSVREYYSSYSHFDYTGGSALSFMYWDLNLGANGDTVDLLSLIKADDSNGTYSNLDNYEGGEIQMEVLITQNDLEYAFDFVIDFTFLGD